MDDDMTQCPGDPCFIVRDCCGVMRLWIEWHERHIGVDTAAQHIPHHIKNLVGQPPKIIRRYGIPVLRNLERHALALLRPAFLWHGIFHPLVYISMRAIALATTMVLLWSAKRYCCHRGHRDRRMLKSLRI